MSDARLVQAEAFNTLLINFNLLVILNPKTPGVVLPRHLLARDVVSLEYGLNMARPILDLLVDASGIGATLSFDNRPERTFIPWEAVAAVQVHNNGPLPAAPPDKRPARRLSSVPANAVFDRIEHVRESGIANESPRQGLRLVKAS